MTTATKYARKCSITGKGMNVGYCIGDGEMYIKDEAELIKYLKYNTGYKNLTEAFEDGYYYYTEWEDDPEEWYDKDGNKFTNPVTA